MLSVLETIRIPLMIEPHVCRWREHWALDGAVGKWGLMDGLEVGRSSGGLARVQRKGVTVLPR